MKILAQDFTYDLPQELVANEPVSPRDHSNLMVVDRKTSELCSKKFYNLFDLLSSNDILVLNETIKSLHDRTTKILDIVSSNLSPIIDEALSAKIPGYLSTIS